jgi:hypothetical protein
VIFAAAGSALAQTCAGMSLGASASLNGFVPFPVTNAWNTNIANAPLDPNSVAITSAAGFAGLHLHPDFGSESSYGIPYVVVDSGATPAVPIHVIDYADQSDVVVAPYPATAPIEGQPADCSGWPDTYNGDAHVLVLDRAKCELYETFNTNRCHGQYDASSETIWDMSSNESRPYGWTSADAAGLPIFPGLVRYDEVASGAIHHAIRFTMEHTKNDANNGYFVAPATHAAGNIWGVSNVMGMRIRLKASFDVSGYSATNQVILTAMKQYGMILADNGGYFFFQGASDPRWDDGDLAQLTNVGSENFEVVQMSPAFPGYDSATAPTGASPVINTFTASAKSVSTGSAVTFSYSVSGDSYDFIDMVGPVKAGSGSVTIHPTATQSYTLNSTNEYGRSVSEPITVTVTGSVVAAPVFTPPAGSYSTTQTVTLTTPTSPDAVIHYTTSGTTPTVNSPVFSLGAPITVSASETIKAIATMTGYAAPSAVSSAAYTIAGKAATPTFTPVAGVYTSAQTVTIKTTTPSATIYYTTDGSNPASSATAIKYAAPITVSKTETVDAVAEAKGFTNSAEGSAAYTIATKAATPTFTPVAGVYTSAQTVTITTTTPYATIYYTTDGSNPASSATAIKYTVPITVSKTETVDAVADARGFTNSAEGSAAYTIKYPLAATPVFTPAAGTYTSVQTVTIKTATPNATIVYTTDGSNPTTSSTALTYKTPITVAKTETLKAFADEPGVTQNSAIGTAAYVINLPAAATPTFTPAAGKYAATQTVTIKTATANATIFYTTDGTNPTTSKTAVKYTAPITVSKTEALKAFSEAPNYANSAVGSAAYAIKAAASALIQK